MAPLRLRPRFRLLVPCPMAEVTARLRAALERDATPFEGRVLSEFAVLRVRPEQQHYWSPELTLQLHDAEGGATLVRGLFGPRPAVWTGFACGYTFTLFASLVLLLFGLSQWSLDIEPVALWLVPVPLGLVAAAFATAWVGQRLGAEQMQGLRDFVDEALAAGPTAGNGSGRSGRGAAPPQ